MLRHDYSWTEVALEFWATLVLGLLAVTSLAIRYVATPISCWVPPEFTGSAVLYAHQVCYQQTEVYIRPLISEGIPIDTQRNFKTQFTYHHWVPFALGVAAILCLLPHVIWRLFSGLLWMDGHSLVQTIADNQRQNAAGRHVMLRDSALLLQGGLRGGNWTLTVAALGRKLLTCVVCLTQVILVVVLFQPQLKAEKGDNQDTEKRDHDYNASLPLPEHFMCDFSIRRLDNVQRYTIQCTLPLAQVYSKGFAFLFYLFLLLLICCVLDVITWICRLTIPGLRDVRIHRYLAAVDPEVSGQQSAVACRFLDSLGLDGRLLLTVTADYCGPLAAADLTNHLWVVFKGTARPGHAPSAPSGSAPPPSVGAVGESSMGGAYVADPAAVPLVTMKGQQ